MRRFALLATLLGSSPAPAGEPGVGESCYLLVFGAQRPCLNNPKYTHSFAAFVRAADCGPNQPILECFTISWLPRTREVDVCALLPEPGQNFGLHVTLREVLCGFESRVSMWGPFQIDPDLFARARAQKDRLESGAVLFKSIDLGWPREEVANCIHVLSDLAIGGPRLYVATPGWGDSASYFITLSLLPWIINQQQTHDWVAERLELGQYPILHRDIRDNPTRGPVLRTVQSVMRRRLTGGLE